MQEVNKKLGAATALLARASICANVAATGSKVAWMKDPDGNVLGIEQLPNVV